MVLPDHAGTAPDPSYASRLVFHAQILDITHPFPVCLMLTAFLDIPLSPQMQLLFLISRYLSLHLQILEYDNVRHGVLLHKR